MRPLISFFLITIWNFQQVFLLVIFLELVKGFRFFLNFVKSLFFRNYPDFQMRPGTYTLFNKDMVGIIETGKLPGNNIYGSQPVYLVKERSGKYHIVFFQSSLPMDIIVGDNLNYPAITYKTVLLIRLLKFLKIGGIFHFKIFLGDEYPETAIKLYHEYLKGFTIPPFWSLGFH